MRECLAYPLSDGPGLGLLVFLPPMLWVLSLPVFDVISVLQPMTKADWALGMLIVPIMAPMIFSFAMTFGYALLFLGHMLVSSALGENDHPRWPEWHPSEISEGIGRWFWAGLFGGALGGIPLVYYRMHCGEIDWFDLFVFLNLITLGVGYAQMALAAALLHDNIIAANPVTVFLAIFRIGWDYLRPCLVAVLVMVLAGAGRLELDLPDANHVAGGARDLVVLGPHLLRGDGRGPDDGADLPRPRARLALVPSPAPVDVIRSQGADLREFLSSSLRTCSLEAPSRLGCSDTKPDWRKRVHGSSPPESTRWRIPTRMKFPAVVAVRNPLDQALEPGTIGPQAASLTSRTMATV